ncbi:glycosyl hydrolase family 28-related protein [Pelagibaculum spongiae]|uniref:Rhamnogalacturonase A/B/Epimerase-like pectate lyase domain-containing protein n=1 Tax=Pelagibaculum spongiae TaxID=2080658 RepID=A0A2V1GZG1_9GAMM|nr:glycosyl hydrolase family 28-related protein [Pelagibaculum spongiae]PVZ68183.1 hypothetical protein DC094_12845 [Pelagibaculum spongiae]
MNKLVSFSVFLMLTLISQQSIAQDQEPINNSWTSIIGTEVNLQRSDGITLTLKRYRDTSNSMCEVHASSSDGAYNHSSHYSGTCARGDLSQRTKAQVQNDIANSVPLLSILSSQSLSGRTGGSEYVTNDISDSDKGWAVQGDVQYVCSGTRNGRWDNSQDYCGANSQRNQNIARYTLPSDYVALDTDRIFIQHENNPANIHAAHGVRDVDGSCETHGNQFTSGHPEDSGSAEILQYDLPCHSTLISHFWEQTSAASGQRVVATSVNGEGRTQGDLLIHSALACTDMSQNWELYRGENRTFEYRNYTVCQAPDQQVFVGMGDKSDVSEDGFWNNSDASTYFEVRNFHSFAPVLNAPIIPRDAPIYFTTDQNQDVTVRWKDVSSAINYHISVEFHQGDHLYGNISSGLEFIIPSEKINNGISSLRLTACNVNSCSKYRFYEDSIDFRLANDFYCHQMPVIVADRTPVCAADKGILPFPEEDQGGAIQTVLTELAAMDRPLYLPPGRYRMDNNLILQNGNSIIGDENGLSILDGSYSETTPFLGNVHYFDRYNSEVIQNLSFENVRVLFYGIKDNIDISNNIFYNTKSLHAQMSITHGRYEVNRNIYLRGNDYPGDVFHGYKLKTTNVTNNFLGDLTAENTSSVQGFLDSSANIRLREAKKLTNRDGSVLDEFQSSYRKGWFSIRGTSFNFNKNYVTSSASKRLYNPDDEQYSINKSWIFVHAKYQRLVATQNYFSGLDDNSRNEIRFWDARDTIFAGNNINFTNFALRVNSGRAPSNVFGPAYFINNRLHNSAINYWHYFVDNLDIFANIPLILVHDNCYSDAVAVHGTWRVINSADNFKLSPNDTCSEVATNFISNHFNEITSDAAQVLIPEDLMDVLDLQIPLTITSQ